MLCKYVHQILHKVLTIVYLRNISAEYWYLVIYILISYELFIYIWYVHTIDMYAIDINHNISALCISEIYEKKLHWTLRKNSKERVLSISVYFLFPWDMLSIFILLLFDILSLNMYSLMLSMYYKINYMMLFTYYLVRITKSIMANYKKKKKMRIYFMK